MAKLKRILFIPDTHRPYHDKKAFGLVLKVGKAFKPDVTVVLGDFADFYSVSSHSKDPARAMKLDEEIKDVKRGLKDLAGLGAKQNVFIEGNHEDRLRRYLEDAAPELHSIISIPQVLGLSENKQWTYVPYKSDYRLGKVYLTHDIGTAGRTSVLKCLDSYQHSNITGHTHRMAYVVEGNAAGEAKLAAQFGWLGDVEAADYMHRMKARKDWVHGFGIGYLEEKTGVVYVTPVPIVNYSCVVEGEFYRG
jgi:predicted phosphodiesterase